MECLTQSGFPMSVISMMMVSMMMMTLSMMMMNLVSSMPMPLASRYLVHQNIFAKLFGQHFYWHSWDLYPCCFEVRTKLTIKYEVMYKLRGTDC